jgi:hypothetical protein
MPNLDVAPNVEAWRLFKRLLVKVNPKVQEADLEQIITGSRGAKSGGERLLPEMRKNYRVKQNLKRRISCVADKQC